MAYVIFDVGANWGVDSLSRTQNNTEVKTWAFEPTPYLVTYLINSSKEFNDRYHVVPLAVSDFNGVAKFNIAIGFDWGCSSLNTFNHGLDETWPGRSDFKVNDVINVEVTRLDSWFNLNKPDIQQIDFFHCDTQGSDLKVLQGMGEYLKLIKEGVVECPTRERSKLYIENHSFEEMKNFLDLNGFFITSIVPNDIHNNEVNVYFKNKI